MEQQVNSTSSVPVPTLIAAALWCLVVAFVGLAWLGFLIDVDDLTRIAGFTAAAIVGPATVAHVRLYANRLCVVIRAQAQQVEPPPLQRIR